MLVSDESPPVTRCSYKAIKVDSVFSGLDVRLRDHTLLRDGAPREHLRRPPSTPRCSEKRPQKQRFYGIGRSRPPTLAERNELMFSRRPAAANYIRRILTRTDKRSYLSATYCYIAMLFAGMPGRLNAS